MKVVIIIPTYNEADNIAPLTEALTENFSVLSHDMHILVVDDNSPDGTAEIVKKLSQKNPAISLITGEKKGLGAAYIRGMQYVLEQMNADVVFEMDADFSHSPSDVPRLLRAIEEGSDFVIGSRYVKGGSIPPEWGLLRRLNSKFGNIVARYVAGIYRVKDCTAGFRAIRTRLLEDINLGDIGVQGYAFQVALLNKAIINGARVEEIPVHFVERTKGESKLGLSDIIEFIINAWWIRVQSSRTFAKFLIVGLIGVVVNLGSFTAFLALGMDKYLASAIAIEASIISNFFLNNYWTFRWRKTRDRFRIKGLKFNFVSLTALTVSYTTFIVATRAFPELAPQVHQALGIVPAFVVNYFLNSYWTFRDSRKIGVG